MTPLSWSIKDFMLAVVVSCFGALLGMAIWWLSPTFTDELEPWDAAGWYYPGSLFAAGFVATLIRPRVFLAAPVGVCAGQVLFLVYLYHPPTFSFLPLGLLFAFIYSFAALAGAFSAALLTWVTWISWRTVRFVFGKPREQVKSSS